MLKSVRERLTLKNFVLAVQHVFAMFGATVLVPFFTGMDMGVALVASGVGTLIYILCTKGKVPVYLGSSFAYLTAILVATAFGGFESVYFGLMAVGIIYVIVATVIRFIGSSWIKKILPPVVIGPMIIIIGLGLADLAISNAGLNGVDWKTILVAVIAFGTTAFVALRGFGFFRIIPFLVCFVVGYLSSWVLGLSDPILALSGQSLFSIPNFTFLGTYSFNGSAILMFTPIAFVTIAEHIGDHTVLSEICEEDFLENPGLQNTLLGDGIATFVSAAIGGPANTTYGENTAVVAVTKVKSTWVTGMAAVFAIMLGFFSPIQAILADIPDPVLGGITIILYGLIASNGVKVMMKAKVDLSNMRNLIIVSAMLVIGLGGAFIPINEAITLTGMSFAALTGIVLNLILPKDKES